MAAEHLNSLGIEYHKEGQKVFSKVLLTATLLVVSHALTIKPSEFDAVGIKLAIDDVIVVHGALAITFYFYFYLAVTLSVEGASFLQFDAMNRLKRALIKGGQKRFLDRKTKRHRARTPKEIKQRARINYNLYFLFVLPYALVFFLILVSALILGAVDVYEFAGYLAEKGQAEAVLTNLIG